MSSRTRIDADPGRNWPGLQGGILVYDACGAHSVARLAIRTSGICGRPWLVCSGATDEQETDVLISGSRFT